MSSKFCKGTSIPQATCACPFLQTILATLCLHTSDILYVFYTFCDKKLHEQSVVTFLVSRVFLIPEDQEKERILYKLDGCKNKWMESHSFFQK